jgi:hypothetical protein
MTASVLPGQAFSETATLLKKKGDAAIHSPLIPPILRFFPEKAPVLSQ